MNSGGYIGGGSGTGIGILIVWLVGYWGVAIPVEVGVVIGSLALSLGAGIGQYGIVGCWERLWFGKDEAYRRCVHRQALKQQ